MVGPPTIVVGRTPLLQADILRSMVPLVVSRLSAVAIVVPPRVIFPIVILVTTVIVVTTVVEAAGIVVPLAIVVASAEIVTSAVVLSLPVVVIVTVVVIAPVVFVAVVVVIPIAVVISISVAGRGLSGSLRAGRGAVVGVCVVCGSICLTVAVLRLSKLYSQSSGVCA